MSFFIPYGPVLVIEYFSTLFSLDLTGLTGYQTLILTLLSNIYFFGFWFFVMYFVLKGFNRIYQKIF